MDAFLAGPFAQKMSALALIKFDGSSLKFGSTYTYAEETLHAVLADADNSDAIASSIKCFVDSSVNCITEFVSNSTGIRYVLKTDGDAPIEAIPTIHISSKKRFAALYYTNELIHNKMMSIRAFWSVGIVLMY